MEAFLRIIYEVVPSAGSNPEVQIDTDELSPPTYPDLAGRGETLMVIAANDVDIEVPILDSCIVIVLADVPVLMRLADAETQIRIRQFAIGAEDADGKALTARSLLFSGTGTPANLRVLYVKDT